MPDILKIKNQVEYDNIMKAVTRYRLEQLSPKKNLTGTYWKKIIKVSDVSNSTFYYFVISDSVNKGYCMVISKRPWGIDIDTNGTVESINPTNPDNKEVSCIGREQFVTETNPLLKKYGLQWIN